MTLEQLAIKALNSLQKLHSEGVESASTAAICKAAGLSADVWPKAKSALRKLHEAGWLRLEEVKVCKWTLPAAFPTLDQISEALDPKPKQKAPKMTKKPSKPATKSTKDGEVIPAAFQRVKDLATCRRPIMLVGPAGCGKTHLSGMVATSLQLKFAAISCSAGMSEAHLLGRSIPNITDGTSRFQGTDFLSCYESGGVFLIDEIDAADSNLLVMLNSGIANGYLSVPSRSENPVAAMHEDFVIIASANTCGRGADRLYVGRAQLDEATIDRFRMGTVQMNYDHSIEEAICPDEVLLDVCHQIRRKIEDNKLRRIMSSRFIKDAFVMRSKAGWSIDEIVDTFFQGWNIDEANRCRPVIRKPRTEADEEAGEAGNIEYSRGKKNDSTDDWALPPLTEAQRMVLKNHGVRIEAVSPKQLDYAERIVGKWMTGLPDFQRSKAFFDELKPISEKAGRQFADRIIRWYKMKYVPGAAASSK